MKNCVSVEYQMYIIISCISTGQPSQATQNFALPFLHYYGGGSLLSRTSKLWHINWMLKEL